MNEIKNISLLLFAIGPVQDLIAAARKTKDLFAGSEMLSVLSNRVVEFFKEKGCDIIYPYTNGGSSSTPNHILLKAPIDTAEELALSAKAVVEKKFQKFVSNAKKTFQINSDLIWDTLWTEQTKNLPEVYYVYDKYDDAKTYSENYRKLEEKLSRRKMLREFEEINYFDIKEKKLTAGQISIKCTLFPHLTAVYTQEKNVKEFWNELTGGNNTEYRSSEKLSTLALTKRKYTPAQRTSFPSTTTIAAGNYYREIANKAGNLEFEKKIEMYNEKVIAFCKKHNIKLSGYNFPSLLKKGGSNTSIKNFLIRQDSWLDVVDDWFTNKSEDIKKELEAIGKDLKQLEEGIETKPGLYYAVIMFDGDNMGKLLSGGFEDRGIKITENDHKEISKLLTEFASDDLPNILENNGSLGVIVYAGGDDLLAFVALEDLLPALGKINEGFKAKLTNYNVTGSIGITIAHKSSNLQQAVNNCRKTLEYAKEILGRDSVAFSLMRRSGEHTICGSRWMDHEGTSAVIRLMIGFNEMLVKKELSTNFFYDLRKERNCFQDSDIKMFLSYLKRMTERHSPKKSDELFKLTAELFNEISDQSDELRINNIHAIDQFMGLLEVSQFITRGGEI